MAAKRNRSSQVDLSDCKLAKEFQMGCLRIKSGHLWPLTHFVWEGSSKFVGATFFCYGLKGWPKDSLVRIEVFRLPPDKEHFAERVEWYTRDRKKRRIRIADGELFEDKMLHPKAFDEEWECDAFATSKGHVIRIYKCKKYAVIFRFLVQSGLLLEHPVFKRLAKNLSIDQDQWETAIPEVVETRKKKSRVEEYAMPEEQESEMWQIVGGALKRLKLARLKTPERLTVIEKEVERLRQDTSLMQDDRTEAAIELGTLLGQTFCWELEWEWAILSDSKGNEEHCVCSPDRSLSIAPVDWIHELLTKKKRALNCLLTFNMVEAGRLPPSRPNAYKRIG